MGNGWCRNRVISEFTTHCVENSEEIVDMVIQKQEEALYNQAKVLIEQSRSRVATVHNELLR